MRHGPLHNNQRKQTPLLNLKDTEKLTKITDDTQDEQYGYYINAKCPIFFFFRKPVHLEFVTLLASPLLFFFFIIINGFGGKPGHLGFSKKLAGIEG